MTAALRALIRTTLLGKSVSDSRLALVLTQPMLDVARATDTMGAIQRSSEALPWVKRAALEMEPAPAQVLVRLLLQSGVIVVLEDKVAFGVRLIILHCILASIQGF
jgi:hypothetical protein